MRRVLTKGKMESNDARLETSVKMSLLLLAFQHDISGSSAHATDKSYVLIKPSSYNIVKQEHVTVAGSDLLSA
jgi:hypothetical protein